MVRNRIYEQAFDQAWIEETRGTPQQLEPLLKPKWIYWLGATIIVLLLGIAALFGLGVLPIDAETATYTPIPTVTAVKPTTTKPLPPTPTLPELAIETTLMVNTETPAATEEVVMATDTPLPTNIAVATATAAAIDTAMPSAIPVLQNNLCSGEIVTYKSSDFILLEWFWAGSLSGQNYLEIRVGPGNDLGYRQAVQDPLSGNQWSYFVHAQDIFDKYPNEISFHWQIVYMDSSRVVELSRSIYGCFDKQ